MFAFLKKVIKNRRILYPAIKVRLSHSLIRKKTLYFFCEKKLPLTIYSSEIFNVSGYLFVPNNTVMQIELMVGVEKFPLRYGSERKDVYYAFLNSYASNSGFSGYITGLPQGNHQSNFLITLIDGKSHIIPCGTINVVEAQDLTIITPPPSQIYIGDTVKITGKWIGPDKPTSIDIHYDHERQKECVFSFETQMFHAELEFLDFRPPYAPIYLSCVTSGRKFT
ncbi:MAG: hypothetical protein LBV68_03370, partial [Spirochaetaceae bacterium]|nr:hypothetical protein [Spirochaetaceae bacterium]